MGYGILLNNYSNTLLYPQVRKVGMEFRTQAFGVNVYGFTNDFKENLGVTGVRLSAPISYGFTGGVSWPLVTAGRVLRAKWRVPGRL